MTGADLVTMERATVRLSKAQFNALEELVDDGRYPNRSEVIRAAVRELLAAELEDEQR